LNRTWGRVALALVGVIALGGMFTAGRLTATHPDKPAATSSHGSAPGEGKNKDLTLGEEARRDLGLTLASVVRSRLQTHLTATAIVAADQQRSATLRPLGRGRVRSVSVRPGDAVRKGEVLITYDDQSLADLRMQMSTADASLAQANAGAVAARDAYARGRALQGTVLAASEVERRRAALAQAQAAVVTQMATKLDLRRRMALLSPGSGSGPGSGGVSTLVSPLDGYVLNVSVSSDDMIEAGRALLTLANLDDVWVLSSVFQQDVQRIDPGGRAVVTVPGLPGRVFEAEVQDIGRMLDPRTGAVQVRCVVANPDRVLRIGMLASAQLPTRDATDALTIPTKAVQQIDGKPVVFVSVAIGKYRKQQIETGLQTSDRVVVRRGLKAGDQVVAQGSFALKSQTLQSEISGD
jgi:cobalt-zinc-cadmium efflux system membrane fusion protein